MLPIILAPMMGPGFVLLLLWKYWIKKMIPIKGKNLVIMGPPSSGKTYLYCKLRGVKYKAYEQTTEDEYEGFEYKKTDGKTIHIASGIDFGGPQVYLEKVRKNIEKCDCVIILFDISKYISDVTYKKDVKTRLDLVWQAVRNQNPDASVSVFMTHADKLSKKDMLDAITIFEKDIAGRPYEKMIVKDNLIPINLTDDKLLKKAIDKLL